MIQPTLHDALTHWIRDVIEQHQRSYDWAVEAYRLEPSDYTAGQLAFCRVANATARQLLSLIPKGFRFVPIRQDWLAASNYRGAGRKKRVHSEESVRAAVARSAEVAAGVSHLAAKLKRHRG